VFLYVADYDFAFATKAPHITSISVSLMTLGLWARLGTDSGVVTWLVSAACRWSDKCSKVKRETSKHGQIDTTGAALINIFVLLDIAQRIKGASILRSRLYQARRLLACCLLSFCLSVLAMRLGFQLASSSSDRAKLEGRVGNFALVLTNKWNMWQYQDHGFIVTTLALELCTNWGLFRFREDSFLDIVQELLPLLLCEMRLGSTKLFAEAAVMTFTIREDSPGKIFIIIRRF
jgi:hypothetical protein